MAQVATGCGGSGGDGDGDGECGFSERYMPFELGYAWTYNVTDLADGVRTTKTQSLAPALVTSPDFPGQEFIEQTTIKAAGTTVSLLTVEGDTVVRYRQEDFDPDNISERVTIYDPPKLRLDETAARLAAGASFDESYTATTTDLMMVETALPIIDHWEVIDPAAACTAPLGGFECVHLRRTRTLGGIAIKDFQFALGIGKVREEGSKQIEEIAACAAN